MLNIAIFLNVILFATAANVPSSQNELLKLKETAASDLSKAISGTREKFGTAINKSKEFISEFYSAKQDSVINVAGEVHSVIKQAIDELMNEPGKPTEVDLRNCFDNQYLSSQVAKAEISTYNCLFPEYNSTNPGVFHSYPDGIKEKMEKAVNKFERLRDKLNVCPIGNDDVSHEAYECVTSVTSEVHESFPESIDKLIDLSFSELERMIRDHLETLTPCTTKYDWITVLSKIEPTINASKKCISQRIASRSE